MRGTKPAHQEQLGSQSLSQGLFDINSGQWCKVTKYIYLSTMLRYLQCTGLFLNSNTSTSTPLRLGSKYCTFTRVL